MKVLVVNLKTGEVIHSHSTGLDNVDNVLEINIRNLVKREDMDIIRIILEADSA